MPTRRNGRVLKATAAEKDKLYKIVCDMIGEKTGESPERVLDRMSKRAVAIRDQRLSRSSRHKVIKRSGFMPNADEKLAAKTRT